MAGLPWRAVLGVILFLTITNAHETIRNIVYLTGQHPHVPTNLPALQQVTHVALAFMQTSLFNDPTGVERTSWPLFTSVRAARSQFAPGTKISVAVGGWGDTDAFSTAARTSASRQRFAHNMAAMVAATGADGVDVDWEYPGGNGEDYKQVPNSAKAWEIEAYPLLLAAIREALGNDYIISAAVPGKPGDMLAFTPATVPRILDSVDFLNVMTYDLMNRRDNVTLHHSGVQNSLVAIDAYLAAGAAPERLNLGFGYYVKYFVTEHADCQARIDTGTSPVGCRTLLMEDPDTGADLGRTGAFSWDDVVPADVSASFDRALAGGVYDEEQGGHYYWDGEQDLWWTFDTPQSLADKFPRVVAARQLGGVFAWGLGEDAPRYENFQAVSRLVARMQRGEFDELDRRQDEL